MRDHSPSHPITFAPSPKRLHDWSPHPPPWARRAHLLQESLILRPQGIPLLGQFLNEVLLLPTLCQLLLVQELALL